MQPGNDNNVFGIDVSSDQGVIDWATVAQDSIIPGRRVQFAWIRAMNGAMPDTQFAANWKGAQAQGIRVGAYCAAVPGAFHGENPPTDAQRAVAAALDVFRQVGGIQGQNMGVALDWEINPLHYSPAEMAMWGKQWVDSMMAAIPNPRQIPIIYTNRWFWSQYPIMGVPSDLWLADWDSEGNPPDFGTWFTWRFWQYRNRATLPGIPNVVDLDEYAGDMTDMIARYHWTPWDQTPTMAAPAAAALNEMTDALVAFLQSERVPVAQVLDILHTINGTLNTIITRLTPP